MHGLESKRMKVQELQIGEKNVVPEDGRSRNCRPRRLDATRLMLKTTRSSCSSERALFNKGGPWCKMPWESVYPVRKGAVSTGGGASPSHSERRALHMGQPAATAELKEAASR